MNLIDYNQAVEALENERKLLLNREQYGAENVLVHHALNVIAELPIVRQPKIIRCKDCQNGGIDSTSYPDYWCSAHSEYHDGEFFCAYGKQKGS